MMLEERMYRQQQRDAGNPYKEGSRQWLAWSKGWLAGQLEMAAQRWEQATGQKINLRRPSTRSK